MIERISLNLATKIKNINPAETKSIDMMRYSISILINLFLTILFLLLGSLIFNNTAEVFIALLFLAVLRAVSGGYHFKSLFVCSIVSAILIIMASLVQISDLTMYIVNSFGFIIMLLKAPVNFTETTIVSNSKFIYFKIVAVCIVGINFVFQNEIFTAVLLLQSVSMINLRRWILT